MSDVGIGLSLDSGGLGDPVPPSIDVFLRPGGVDTYLRPGGVDTYKRAVNYG